MSVVSNISLQPSQCSVEDFGLIDYEKAYVLQRQYVDGVIAQKRRPCLMFCEHPSVLTLGRSGHEENLLMTKQKINELGIKILNVDRGGDVTLHSPGQQIVYPILNLNDQGRDLHRYLLQLEQVGIDLLGDFDILATRIPGKTGVYVEGQKIMSLGVGVRKWISYHGIGININTDLSYFSLIKPCGLDVSMTSMATLKKSEININDVKEKILEHFCRVFKLEII